MVPNSNGSIFMCSEVQVNVPGDATPAGGPILALAQGFIRFMSCTENSLSSQYLGLQRGVWRSVEYS